MEQLLYGAAYYLEYMPYDRLEKDLDMLQVAGMNVIRIAESTWSTLEPVEGTFDYSFIDSVLEAATKRNMQVIIGTPTYAIPAWLAKKADDVMVETKEGQKRYGSRQIMNIMSPTFRFYAERVIRKLMERTAHYACVIGFQIDNETKHYGTANAYVQGLFKEYLIHKFQTVEKLNETFGLAYWSNAIGSWEDLPDMRGCINGGLSGEFEAFQRGLVTQYLAWQVQIVQEYKREDQFVTQNLDFEWKKFGADIAQDGYSYGVQLDVNHAEVAKLLDIAGVDIYHPTQHELTGAEIAFGGDEIRSLKQDNYLVLETEAQAFKYWTPYPGQARLHAYSHLASGADGVMYWNWHSIHNGYETYWKGVLSHDLETNPTYEEMCTVGQEWQKLSKELLHLKKKNEVALLVDNRTLTAFKWFPIDRDLSYNDVVRWMYDSLYEMNIECDVVFESNLDTHKYKMIVTPALYCASEALLGKLEQFVAEGGVLISSFKSFVANEQMTVYHDKQPHMLHDCFGMSYNQFVNPERLTIDGCDIQYFAELLKLEGAECLGQYTHPYWNRYTGITKNTYQKGTAYYIGCYFGKDKLKEIYQEALKDAKLQSTIPEVNWPVTIRSGVNALNHTLHYVLHYSEEPESFTCPYQKVTDILTGKQYRQGDEIHLKDWDVLILKEEKDDDSKSNI